MNNKPISTWDWLWYFIFMGTIAAPCFVIAWFVSGLFHTPRAEANRVGITAQLGVSLFMLAIFILVVVVNIKDKNDRV